MNRMKGTFFIKTKLYSHHLFPLLAAALFSAWLLPSPVLAAQSQPVFYAFRHCQLISVAKPQRQKGLYDPEIQYDVKKLLVKIGLVPSLHPKERDLSKLMRDHPPKLKDSTARQYLLPTPKQKLWVFGYAPALDGIKYLGVTEPAWFQASYNGEDGDYELDFKINLRPLMKVISKLSGDTRAEVLEWALFVSVPKETAEKDQPQESDEDLTAFDPFVEKIHAVYQKKIKDPKLADDCPVIARQVIRALGSRYLVLVMGCKGGPVYQVYKIGKNINTLVYTDSMKVD
jgi:hypothetical protein